MSGKLTTSGLEIAVIGMAGRFPGARDLEQFWQNLCGGVESIRRFTAEDLAGEGLDPRLLEEPDYVPAAAVLEGIEEFDAEVFGYTPREAEILDPQQRLFLELAWEALERAGYTAQQFSGLVGVYAGAKFNHYVFNLYSRPELLEEVGTYQAMVSNDKDYLAVRTSYKLGLTGPSVGVQTACSTSLVAVHLACQGLLAGECDLALAGGVSLTLPHRAGYRYTEGGILSRDGHCRAFDAAATGTVGGSGLGIVVLRRLADALEAGDRIQAVILGSAINNDGAQKVGFTAPSVEGQARVVRAALEFAEVDPATVTYVEAHGTGTALGDPVEVSALARAFRRANSETSAQPVGYCGLGSVKSNIGHLDPAAGVVGLIKTALMLERAKIPPTLHLERPNPAIGLEGSPFYLVRELADWRPPAGCLRRAGVSSFGIGGTNAHVVLEQAPPAEPSGASRPLQLLLLSAKTARALETASDRLAEHLHNLALRPRSNEELADAAFTLKLGRHSFDHRRIVICRDAAEGAERLSARDPEHVLDRYQEPCDRPVAFLFPGQGTQYLSMGRELYAAEPIFRETIDRAAEILAARAGLDLTAMLYPEAADTERRERAWQWLGSTAGAQPALFSVELALARLWMSWGIEPELMLGHSIGEYVAAHLAGVFSLEDALMLVAERGRLMQALPRGAMLGISLGEEDARSELDKELSLASVNGPESCVLAGPEAPIEALAKRLEARGVLHRRLHTSHAFHSWMMEPALEPFAGALAKVRLAPPERPFFSNLTGELIRAEQATDPRYWQRHLRETVRFGPALGRLWQEPNRILLEVGPGRALSTLARQHPARPPGGSVLESLPAPPRAGCEPDSALEHVLTSLGRLWLAGRQPDWPSFYKAERRRRAELPTYPFERRRYWVSWRPPARDETRGRTLDAPVEATVELATQAEPSRPQLETPYVAPRNETERRVAEVWQRLLGIEPIGVYDNFFELGGGSLLATQLTARLRSTLGVELSLAELLENPTVRGVAGLLGQDRRPVSDQTTLPRIAADPAHRHEPFPLTDVQQAYWIGRGSGLELGNVSTHYYVEYEIQGLDLDRFSRALQRTIERQHMLRAVVSSDGQQRILAEVPAYEMEVLDLEKCSVTSAAAALAELRGRMSHHVLASDTWPLFAIAAARLAQGRIRLHISFDFLLGDAWSLQLLLAELERFYVDPEVVPTPLEISFREYVLAEEAMRGGELYQRSLEYWRRRLATLPPGPELPLSRSAAQIDRPRFVRRVGRLDGETWGRLKARAAGAGLTPSGVLVAAFAEVLRRWSTYPAFTLSLTLFNRQPFHPQVNELIGDFTSLVLLEVDAGGGPFEEHARRLQSRLWNDLDHRFVSGVGVVREHARAHGRAGSLNLPVVFTSLLGLGPATDSTRAPRGFASGLQAQEVFSISQTPQVLIDHQVDESGGELAFNWDAVEEVFPERFLDELFGAYQQLLAELADSGEAWSRPLGSLLPLAQHELLTTTNATGPPLAEGLLHNGCEEQADLRPHAIALIDGDLALSYGELNHQAECLAGSLRANGVRRGDRVAVLLAKGWRQAVATLAALKARSAYLPVAPELPSARIAYLLEHGGVDLGLSRERSYGADSRREGVKWLMVESAVESVERAPFASRRLEAADLAYVIFTSGSTGQPKGVAISHRAAVNTLVAVNRRFGVGCEDRVLALSSLSFDLSVYDLFGIWAAGGCTIFPPAWQVPDPTGWAELAARARVTIWNSVPALLEMVVEQAAGRRERLSAPLRFAMLSGDWIPVQLPARISVLAPDAEVVSLGGATEVSVWSIWHPVEPGDGQRPSIPYGRPMPAQTFHVLDERLYARPLWVPGDLYIGGAGLARGYWASPRRTATAFIPDATSVATAGARLYRTGDRGRVLPDGEIEFLGREDNQVKIHGHRIELGEIEANLALHPKIESAVAAAVGTRSDLRLVAWVVGRSGQPLWQAELKEFLATKLPSYMVPTHFEQLAELPLTTNGKVDRKSLDQSLAPPAVDVGGGEATATRGPVEALLCTLCAAVLDLEHVEPTDNFFGLGGHSLLATRLLSRLREVFHVELPLRQLFEEPTMAELARAVEAARRAQAQVEMPPIERLPRDGRPLPLSSPQQRLFFIKQLAPESPVYNVHLGMRISGELRVQVLGRCLDEIVNRHEALRTIFLLQDGQPVQRVLAPRRVPLPVIDLTSLNRGEREPESDRWVRCDLRVPFSLAPDPLWRTRLFRLTEQEHLLFFMTHHIVWDDWSEGLFWRELGVLYGSFAESRPSPLAPLKVQYADYSSWQRQWLAGPVRERQLAYWRRQLEGAPRLLELPLDRPRPKQQSFRGSTEVLRFDAARSRALDRFGRERQATLYMVMAAATKTLLHRLSGQEEIVIGTLTGNRNRPEIEGLIGFFINTLALRTRFSGSPSFAQLVGQLRETALEAFDHQDLPFEQVIEELRLPRDLRYNPLTQVVFNQFTAERAAAKLPDLTFQPLTADPGWAPFDLTATVVGGEAGMVYDLQYASDLFDRSTMIRFGRSLRTLIDAALAHPDRPVGELPLLSKAEHHQVAVEWNDAASTYPSEESIPALFERWVEKRPDAPALEGSDESWTYAEIEAEAERLASFLRELGVTLETRVGLLFERSPRTVLAMLAVLKAGGVYLPLDPSYPEQRLRWMIEDSSISVVLSEKHLIELVPTGSVQMVCLDRDRERIAAAPRTSKRAVPAGALAYVMYTSGSTGTPKGVGICHRSIVRLVRDTNYVAFDRPGAFLQLCSTSFDVSTFEIWGALLNGGRLVVLSGRRPSLDEIAATISADGIGTMWLTSGLFHQMVEHRLESLATVDQLLAGGDVLQPHHVRRVLEALPGVRMINGYGPTENTSFTTCYSMSSPRQVGSSVPIGRPIANSWTLVLDPTLTPVPIGVTGDLFTGGAGLARGYLGRPGLTAERFVPDPSGIGGSGRRLYRTGDLARTLADGRIDFLGRNDGQVKVRGFRVELGEIETALVEHPGVRGAAVVAHRNESGTRLVGYVIPIDGSDEPPADLEVFLRTRLPEHAVPGAFVALDALPLTPNGKIDRRALKPPERGQNVLPGSWVAPSGDLERLLAEVWAGVLRIERISAHDNFFALGGDSILTIQVAARCHELGLELAPSQFFEHPTVAKLAAALGGATDDTEREEDGPLPTALLPLAPIQHWFFQLRLVAPEHFNHALLLSAPEDFDTGWLRGALARLLEHHDALRLGFEQRDGEWFQRSRARGATDSAPVVEIDLGALAEPTRSLALGQAVATLHLGFDLGAGRLLRAAVLRLGPGRRSRLFWVVHHLVVDGVSWRLLLDQFHTLYRRRAESRPPLVPPAISYARWVRQLAALVDTAELRAELDDWLTSGNERCAILPVDYLDGRNLVGLEAEVVERLDPELTRALLQEVQAAWNVRVDRALLTALARVLTRWCGHHRLRLDLEGHGREALAPGIDPSRTVGWFTCLYPVTLEVDLMTDWPAALAQVSARLDALPRSGLGYGVLRHLSPDPEVRRVLAHLPPSEIVFNYLGRFEATLAQDSPFKLAPESVGPSRNPASQRPYRLEINAAVSDDRLEIVFSYSTELFRRRTIEKLAGELTAALTELVAHCRHGHRRPLSPADFPASKVTTEELDSILSQLK